VSTLPARSRPDAGPLPFSVANAIAAVLSVAAAEGLAVLLTMRGNGPQDVIRAQLGTALAYVNPESKSGEQSDG
jgi:hypothetical protein